MKKPKPLGRHEVTERAFTIACEMMALSEMEINTGDGPATELQIRRFLRGCARRELLEGRRQTDGA